MIANKVFSFPDTDKAEGFLKDLQKKGVRFDSSAIAADHEGPGVLLAIKNLEYRDD